MTKIKIRVECLQFNLALPIKIYGAEVTIGFSSKERNPVLQTKIQRSVVKTNKPVAFSGVQPTGELNIGSYIGSIKNWIEFQKTHKCIFSIVDLHSITVKQDSAKFGEKIEQLAALYLACGVDPTSSIIFCQSHVPQHAELAWILSCYTHLGELSRMTQFKDKSKKHAENINVGLFSYPVLMAADILLYDTNLVPVGQDQKQHVELTRDIAQRFNKIYGNVFVVPEVYIPKCGARIMGLQNPESKMSKSDANPKNVLKLTDNRDEIIKKIKSAVTDSEMKIVFDKDNRPGISNLLTIFSAISCREIKAIVKEYEGCTYGKFKEDLAILVADFLVPIREKYELILRDTRYLKTVLAEGVERALEIATKKMRLVKEVIGFLNL